MPFELGGNAHRLEVPYHDPTVDSTGGEVIASAIESQRCRMTRTDGVRDVLGVVLEEVVVGEKQVHGGDGTLPLAG